MKIKFYPAVVPTFDNPRVGTRFVPAQIQACENIKWHKVFKLENILKATKYNKKNAIDLKLVWKKRNDQRRKLNTNKFSISSLKHPIIICWKPSPINHTRDLVF